VNNESKIDNLIQDDDCFRVLTGERNSPSFWSKKKKEILTMVFFYAIFVQFLIRFHY
jgi:hypothetical protein